jgi:N-acyl-D-aspartate/D-glutamate deacylase
MSADDQDGGQRGGQRRPVNYAHLFPLGDEPDYEPPADKSIERLAAVRGVDPAELTLDLLSENEGRNFLYMPILNYAEGNLDACGEMLAHPDTLFGLGDGGAHVGLISDASFPTYFLSHWARDRSHGQMPVGRVVERLTKNNARAVGLFDRGIVAEGMKADLNVIDFDRVRCEPPVMAYDLPAGGKRLTQRARGYCATVVAGQVTYRDGEPTGALPGRLLRGGRDTGPAAGAQSGR